MNKVRAPHYTVVEDAVIDDARLSPFGLLVYIAIRRHVNADGECWPSWARVALLARCKRAKVAEAIKELKTLGYLTVASGQITGRTNTYALFGPVQQVDGGVQQVDGGGVQQVDAEVSSEEKYLQEEHTVAIAPGAKPSPYRLFSDLFVERSGHKWAAGTKEGVCLSRLVKWAKDEQPARWEEYLRAFMDGAWALKQGELVGMRDFDKRRWASMPYTPSALLNQCSAIVAALETTQVKPMDADAYADSLLAKVGK